MDDGVLDEILDRDGENCRVRERRPQPRRRDTVDCRLGVALPYPSGEAVELSAHVDGHTVTTPAPVEVGDEPGLVAQVDESLRRLDYRLGLVVAVACELLCACSYHRQIVSEVVPEHTLGHRETLLVTVSPGHVPKRENVADVSVGAVTQCDVLQIVTLLATADRRGDRSAVEVGEPRLVSVSGVEKHRWCPANDRRCVDYLPCHGVRIDDPTVGVEHKQSVTGLFENVSAGDRCPHEQVEAKERYPDEPPVRTKLNGVGSSPGNGPHESPNA